VTGPVGRAPHVALLLNNDFRTDSRSWKLARTLTDRGFRVTVVARPLPGAAGREHRDGFEVVRVDRPSPRWLPAPSLPCGGDAAGPPARARGRLRALARETVGRLAQAARYLWLARAWGGAIVEAVPHADVWQAEGLITLPVALDLRRRSGGRVVYDSRVVLVESAGFARLPPTWRRLLRRRERSWVRSADALVTVSRPYREVLERSLGRTATIVMNGPLAIAPPDRGDRRLSVRLGLPPDAPIVLSLGQVAAGRGIGTLIDAVGRLDGVHLVIAGFGPSYEAMRERAADAPARDRIHFLPGVAPAEIPATNAAADVAAMPVRPTTLNHRLNTPTKLFDAMGAGTPVVASRLPGMAEIVGATGCGELCEPGDPDDVARAIRTILEAPPERRAAYGEAGIRAVRDTYAWDRQVEALVGLYAALGVTAYPAGFAAAAPESN
jgi:glycosyltransferase involved in cell wall biosynthesis